MKHIFAIVIICIGYLLASSMVYATDLATTPSTNIKEGSVMLYSQKVMPPLTDEEKRVIINKKTEAPFTGKYDKFDEKGCYVCRQCGIPLFLSSSKFDSKCGWPAFDDEILGRVKRIPDPDGQRVEIICANCKGHLGHVFRGEELTPTNTRYCVNSVSMAFVPEPKWEMAVVAGGCFWGVENAFDHVIGVKKAISGYCGGTTPNPTYKQVCTGETGHAEAVKIEFDPATVTYEQLLRQFFELHDPTQLNRQGPDVGTQYRSAVFVTNAAQQQTAEKLIELLKAKGWDVKTTVEPLTVFYPAEDYHQNFTDQTGRGKCHAPVKRFDVSPGQN